MAFGGNPQLSGFSKLAPLARSASPRYGVLRGIGGVDTTIPKPRGIKVPKPGAAVAGMPNLKSGMGKLPSLGKLRP